MSETGGSLDGTLLNELFTRYDPDAIQASFSPVPEAQEERLFTPGLAQAPIETLAPMRNLTPGPAPASEKLYSSALDRASQALYTPPMETPEQLYSEYEPDDYSGIDNVYIATYRAPVDEPDEPNVFDKYPQGHSEAWLKQDDAFYRLVRNRPGLSAADRATETLETDPVAYGFFDSIMPANKRVEFWGDYLTPELTIPESLKEEERDDFVRSHAFGMASKTEHAAWGADWDAFYTAHKRKMAEENAQQELQAANAASPTTALAPPPTPSAPRVITPEATGAESAGGVPAPGASGASGLLSAFNAAATAVQSAERSAEQPEALGADATAAAAPATTASPAQSASTARAAAPPLTASPRVVSQRSDAETTDEPAITEPAVRLPRRTQVPDSSQELVQKLTEIELWLGEISHTLKENRGSAEDGTYRGMHALADELVRLIRNSADREFSRRGWY